MGVAACEQRKSDEHGRGDECGDETGAHVVMKATYTHGSETWRRVDVPIGQDPVRASDVDAGWELVS